jgi:hypothetical protein
MKIHAAVKVTVQTGPDTWESQTMILDCWPENSVGSIVERMIAKTCPNCKVDNILRNGFHFEMIAESNEEVTK